MWNKSFRLLMVRVKVTRHSFAFPVPVWVVSQLMYALTDLVWVGEKVIARVPLPRDEKTRKNLSWIKECSASGVMNVTHNIIKDLTRYKGLDLVDVEVGEVRVKISIK
ncbi:MAG TPA: hypothetical protein VFC84_14425 [Desulfosporosinus sp.]|nr:hypothetical protein [Desulfosporosinus sp.]